MNRKNLVLVPKSIWEPVIEAYRTLTPEAFKAKVLELDRVSRAAVMATVAMEARKFEKRRPSITEEQYKEFMSVGNIIAETLKHESKAQ